MVGQEELYVLEAFMAYRGVLTLGDCPGGLLVTWLDLQDCCIQAKPVRACVSRFCFLVLGDVNFFSVRFTSSQVTPPFKIVNLVSYDH